MNDSVPYICWQDFLRAGMTCFTLFYQEGAQSYQDLAHRINWLFTAQQHMQVRLGSCMHPETSNMYSKAQKKMISLDLPMNFSKNVI